MLISRHLRVLKKQLVSEDMIRDGRATPDQHYPHYKPELLTSQRNKS